MRRLVFIARRGQFLPEPASKGSLLIDDSVVDIMPGVSPTRGSARSGNVRLRSSNFSLCRILCYSALLMTLGWAIFSISSKPHGSSRVSPAAFVSRDSEAEPSKDDTGLLPASSDPEGCQTVVFFHIPKTGGESLNNLWQVTRGGGRRLFGWAGYRLMGLRRSNLSPIKQEEYLRHM